MPLLDNYPDLMTKEEIAEILRYRPGSVPRLKGLKKTFVGNGRKKFLYRKEDLIDYINSKVEREEVREDASKQEKRHGQMGLSSLLSWNELQKA